MNLFIPEQNSPKDLVVQAFRFLNREDKTAAFSLICSEMMRTRVNAERFDDFVIPDYRAADNYVEIIACPNDPSHEITKNGKDRNGRQRYKCKTCNKTFFAANHALSSSVNQDVAVWCRFVSGMLQQESISSLAQNCSISQATVMSWQLRVFEAIRQIESETKLSDIVIADDMRIDYNLKGNHADDFIMPRRSRKRGSENTIKNYQKNSICVLCAIDNNGKGFSKVIGFGNPSGKRIIDGFSDKLSENVSVLVTDGAQVYGKAVKHYNIPQWERKVTVTKGNKRVPDVSTNFNIQRINNYHSQLRKFLSKYNGVSSRRLPGYLLLFDFLQNHRGEDIELMCCKILTAMAMRNNNITDEQLESKYTIPVSNGREKETWEVLIPRKEQNIYRDWYNRIPISEIIRKYNINKHKIYTIRDKVNRLDVHDKIMNRKTTKSHNKKGTGTANNNKVVGRYLEIYYDYMTTDMTLMEVGNKYGISYERVRQIVITVKKSGMVDIYQKKKKQTKKKSQKRDLTKRDDEIFSMYQFLSGQGMFKNHIYELIGQKYGLSKGSIEHIILKKRKDSNMCDFSYAWTEERKTLPKEEYSQFLEARNKQIYDEFLKIYTNNPFVNKTKVIETIYQKYNLSFSHCSQIIRTQQRLRQQEQVPEPELSYAG